MQAARGTPVDHSDNGADDSRSRGRFATRTWLGFAALAASLYAVDQLTKHLAVAELRGEPDVRVVGELLQLHLTYNPGAAFSVGTSLTAGLTCLAIVAVLIVLWMSRRLGSRTWAAAFGFLLAGITGNLTDRILRDPAPFRGHVVDFLMLPNWPIFNVADICINVGVALILLQVLRGVAIDGTRHASAEKTPQASRTAEPPAPSGPSGPAAPTGESAE